jgi:hypothetical protein
MIRGLFLFRGHVGEKEYCVSICFLRGARGASSSKFVLDEPELSGREEGRENVICLATE